MKERIERRLQITDLVVLGLTLAVTLMAAVAVYQQTAHHFASERISYFTERFNRSEFVDVRATVDAWLETGESAESLFHREGAKDPEAIRTIKNMRAFANFFQELAAAMKHETLDKEYMWDVFGFLTQHYGEKLQPFIDQMRATRKRSTLYAEFYELVRTMKSIERKHK